jgi:hypothetical protein
MGQRNSNTLKNYDPKDYKLEENLNLNLLSYPNQGLYHPKEVLDDIYPKIILWPIERQIEYSDCVTRKYALNQFYLDKLKIQLDVPLDQLAKTGNATMIGNLAFIAYHNGINSEFGIHYTKILKYLKFNFT